MTVTDPNMDPPHFLVIVTQEQIKVRYIYIYIYILIQQSFCQYDPINSLKIVIIIIIIIILDCVAAQHEIKT